MGFADPAVFPVLISEIKVCVAKQAQVHDHVGKGFKHGAIGFGTHIIVIGHMRQNGFDPEIPKGADIALDGRLSTSLDAFIGLPDNVFDQAG